MKHALHLAHGPHSLVANLVLVALVLADVVLWTLVWVSVTRD